MPCNLSLSQRRFAALPDQFMNLPNLASGAPTSIIAHAVKVIMATDLNADAQDTFYITGTDNSLGSIFEYYEPEYEVPSFKRCCYFCSLLCLLNL